jgi:hypothetical protein
MGDWGNPGGSPELPMTLIADNAAVAPAIRQMSFRTPFVDLKSTIWRAIRRAC